MARADSLALVTWARAFVRPYANPLPREQIAQLMLALLIGIANLFQAVFLKPLVEEVVDAVVAEYPWRNHGGKLVDALAPEQPLGARNLRDQGARGRRWNGAPEPFDYRRLHSLRGLSHAQILNLRALTQSLSLITFDSYLRAAGAAATSSMVNCSPPFATAGFAFWKVKLEPIVLGY